ncbi:Hypothetical predicted protein [Pelobates cultripes]|uniref:Uncharacterized protein n=1 Tax=Pelobates cultripes TaxID=61616 RepID=A0AAD1WCT7_PELCU|nr:Hypothetical predicted protein [Pelobates cultripes]
MLSISSCSAPRSAASSCTGNAQKEQTSFRYHGDRYRLRRSRRSKRVHTAQCVPVTDVHCAFSTPIALSQSALSGRVNAALSPTL